MSLASPGVKSQLEEVPRVQRMATHPVLEEIFETGIRCRGDSESVLRYAYMIEEIADKIGVHYATVGRRLHQEE